MLATLGGVYRVPEGHVAVTFRGGALLKETRGPGLHIGAPFLDRVHMVQTTVQTDKVANIPCGTSGGTVIHFDRIEVVNQLREDAVYETVKCAVAHASERPDLGPRRPESSPLVAQELHGRVRQDVDLRQDPPRGQPDLLAEHARRDVHHQV